MVMEEAKSKDIIAQEIKLKKSLNDTSMFLLPVFRLKIESWFKLGFINAFLKDKNREKVNDKDIHIYLLFKPNAKQKVLLDKKIEVLEETDVEHINYLEDYDIEGGYTVLVLKFPEKFRKDYDRFLKGKYSYFSKDFQDIYPEDMVVDFINENNKVEKLAGKSLPWMIINRDIRMKKFTEKKYDITLDDDDEVYHRYVEKDETLDSDLLNND